LRRELDALFYKFGIFGGNRSLDLVHYQANAAILPRFRSRSSGHQCAVLRVPSHPRLCEPAQTYPKVRWTDRSTRTTHPQKEVLLKFSRIRPIQIWDGEI
jgi:hypothetical protein